jgi:hypothetical protein
MVGWWQTAGDPGIQSYRATRDYDLHHGDVRKQQSTRYYMLKIKKVCSRDRGEYQDACEFD